jgi:hypothetical protein
MVCKVFINQSNHLEVYYQIEKFSLIFSTEKFVNPRVECDVVEDLVTKD